VAISPDEVRHIAGLARLQLSEEELPEVAATLDTILSHVGQLQEVNSTATPTELSPLIRQPDISRECTSESYLALSEGRSGRFVEVPTVVSTGTGDDD
jgi:aspartyl-tRNA(Asn)/glutamyl-tRNA(Gln) amidotransferase subunit C